MPGPRCRAPPAGHGLTAAQRLRRRRRPGAGRRRLRRGAELPVRSARRTSTSSAAGRTTRAARARGWPTRSATTSRCCAPRCCRACSRALRRNVGRGFADVALFEIGLVFRPSPAGAGRRRRSCRSTAGPPTRSSPRWRRRCPTSRCALARRAGRRPRAGRLVGRGPRRPAGQDAIEAAREVAAGEAGCRSDGRGRPARALAPGPLRGAARDRDGEAERLVGHAGELHPRVIEAFGLPRPDLRDGARPVRDRDRGGRARAGAGAR